MIANGPQREKTCLRWFANNKGADQPAHPRSLISTFVIRLLERIISRLAMSEISIFLLVSVSEDNGFRDSYVGNPKDRFSHDKAQIKFNELCCSHVHRSVMFLKGGCSYLVQCMWMSTNVSESF